MSEFDTVVSRGNEYRLPKLPENWKWIKLKYHCDDFADYGVNVSSDNYQNDGVRFIRTTDICEDGSLSEEDPVYVSDEVAEGNLLRDGDLLLSRSGTVGKSFQYSNEKHGRCTYASYLVRFQIKDGLSSRYFSHYCNSHLFDYLMDLQSTESTISNVSGDKFANFPVPTPKSTEMVRIANILDNEIVPINELVEKLRILQAQLEQKKQNYVYNQVTGKQRLNDAIQLNDENSWFGAVPDDWERVRTRFIARLESGHTPSKSNDEYWEDTDIPWVSLADSDRLRHNDYISETEKYTNKKGLANSSAHILPEGTVVFTRDATVGLCSIIERPMAVSQHIVGWVCGPRILPEYLLNVLKSMDQEFDRLTRGSTISTIGMHDIESFKTPLPPLEEQREIVDHIETETERLWELIDRVEETIDLLEEKRQALITKAVTGQIDLSDWQPPDKHEATQ